jgi:hypothetical protein
MKENEQEIMETARMRDQVWKNAMSNIPEDEVDTRPIFTLKQQRDWHENQR